MTFRWREEKEGSWDTADEGSKSYFSITTCFTLSLAEWNGDWCQGVKNSPLTQQHRKSERNASLSRSPDLTARFQQPSPSPTGRNLHHASWRRFFLSVVNTQHDSPASQSAGAEVLVVAGPWAHSAGDAQPNVPSDEPGRSAAASRWPCLFGGWQWRTQPYAAHTGWGSCGGGFEAVRGGRRW